MLTVLVGLVAAFAAVVLVQDIVYFLRGHDSAIGVLFRRKPRTRVIRIPCTRIEIRESKRDG